MSEHMKQTKLYVVRASTAITTTIFKFALSLCMCMWSQTLYMTIHENESLG